MAKERAQRRLAAIIAADVVGYSKMMGQDEEGTLSRLKKLRSEFLHPKVSEYGGRIVKTTGDGTLIEFGSAVDAVSHAIDVQRGLSERNAELFEGEQIQIRMGINVGDIIIEDDDLYGDGVNIAARLEPMADPGGICISRNVYNQIKNKISIGFIEMGPQKVKNIEEAVVTYKIILDSETKGLRTTNLNQSLTLPDKPSVAVLPFDNLSGDPEQEYFSDGMTDDIITDLSKNPDLFVIARNSSFVFKGQIIDAKEIGNRLGVKYILEGSVRRVGPKIRINAQLINAESGGHMWADRYDGDINDIFSLQDEITAKIVNAFEFSLAASDRGDEKRVPTSNGEAYDLFLKARTHFYLFTPEGLKEAKAQLESVVRLDPNFAEAYSLLSYCYFIDWNFHMADEAVLKRALDVAQKAVELDPNSGYALARLGWVLCFFRRYEEAIETFERAIIQSPSNAEVYAYYGETLNYADKAEKGLEMTEQGIRLDPLGPPNWDFHRGHSYYKLRSYDEALAAMTQSINRGPTFPVPYLFLAVLYVELDQLERATEMIDAALKYNPAYRIDNIARVMPHNSMEQRVRFIDGLRKAGLPEE